MHTIVRKKQLSPNVTWLEVTAARIAQIRRAGQFVIVRQHEQAERIPLTIADANPATGTITLIIQAVGRSTREMVALEPGESILDICGPLGQPTELPEAGHALCIGGGVGTAVIRPIAEAIHRHGVKVTSIIGGRSREWVILEDDLRQFGEVLVCTDDGSHGRKGFVTEAAADFLKANPVTVVYGIGPVPMMRAVANLTRPLSIKTIVSLNPVMVDGTGMCGGCRVLVGNVTRFACVDGPEFDGHLVDFDLLTERLGTYKEQERLASEACTPETCRVGLTPGPVQR